MKAIEKCKNPLHNLKFYCAMVIIAFSTGCQENNEQEPLIIHLEQLPTNPEYSNYPLQGTAWKLSGFANLSDSTFRFAKAAKDLRDFSYRIRFETDSTFTGTTSANTIFGDYSSDFALGTISIIGFWGSKRGEEYDGDFYRESLKLVETYSISKYGLRLYFQNGRQFLLYIPLGQ